MMFSRTARVTLFIVAVMLCQPAASARTIYVHLLDGDDKTGNGSYEHPFKSWRMALRNVTSGDTIIAKNGDYRKAGREGKWGGLDLALTLADPLEAQDPHPASSGRPDAIGIYRYNPKNPLIIRAESKYGVILDHIRLHLARG